MALNICFV